MYTNEFRSKNKLYIKLELFYVRIISYAQRELVLTDTQVISVRNIITVQDVFLFHLE